MAVSPTRYEILPLSDHEVSLRVDGRERLRWHGGTNYPRPYFFPLVGPSGQPLTRMGHPGAPNHDHHQSIWFAHNKVLGIDFWGNGGTARIRQKQWLSYQLTLRYLLYAHRERMDGDRASAAANEFLNRPKYAVARSSKPHLMYEVSRV